MFLELRNFFKHFIESLLNLVYKQKCVVCGFDLSCSNSCSKLNNFLCKTCLKNINYLNTFSTRIVDNVEVFSAAIYDGTVKKLIQGLKFSHKRQCGEVLAYILYDYFKRLDLNKDYVFCFPQSHYFKKAQRGYEHMELIVGEFAKLTGLNYERNLIKKIKNIKPQYKARDRFKNVIGAYKINSKLTEKYRNKNILIIDDIITTGATIEAILKEFKKEGFNNLTVLTVSKAGV